MIVLEGPDSAGKTTLLSQLVPHFPTYNTIHSEGPEKYPGEINERIARLNRQPVLTIFDRHPTVSHPIYDGRSPLSWPLVDQFLARSPRLVLVLPDPCPLEKQEATSYNTPAHIRYLEENHQKIIDRYRCWARMFSAFHYDRTNFEELLKWLGR